MEPATWRDNHNGYHFAGQAVSGAVSAAFIDNKWAAFGVAMIPGLVREEWKRQNGYTSYSAPRMFWNTVGAAAGVGLTTKLRLTADGVQYNTTF